MEGLQLKYFTLNPGKRDPFGAASRAAMQTYATAIESENPVLAKDLRDWVDRETPKANDASHLRIGECWDQYGGVYAGIVRGDPAQPDYHLIVLDQHAGNVAWQAAKDWAAEFDDREEQSAGLPRRKELAVLFGNVPELFDKTWYWSCEQFEGDEASAWCQDFYDGSQSYGHKVSLLRARAVRRVPLSY